ncbi:MAG: hypothetical protein AAF480_06840 [Actinomycetota bacterium]
MPRGSSYPGSPDDLERYRQLVEAHPDGEVLGAKNPYTSRNGWMTSFLDPDGLICFRLGDEGRRDLLDAGGSEVRQYGRNMPDFAAAPPGASRSRLEALFARCWEHAGTLPAK